MRTVSFTVDTGLCISCGICEAVCPMSCISMHKEVGLYTPKINNDCVNCGLCFSVCPGKGEVRKECDEVDLTDLIGGVKCSYNAWSRDSKTRHYSASGGVITSIINNLLLNDYYDVAFVVRSFNYSFFNETEIVTKTDDLLDFSDDCHLVTKSRYVPIGHATTIRFIINNPDKKAIIIGTPCAIAGVQNVVRQKSLLRDNYLFIGLFCESVLNYNVWNYFKMRKFTKGRDLKALHFKNKESGGWPGNMKLLYSDGNSSYKNKKYRAEIKPFFKPERCIYCVDKLNTKADISIGDNYTGIDSSLLGSNSIIIRTQRGVETWERIDSCIEYYNVNIQSIVDSQYLAERMNNINYSALKEESISRRTNVDLDINAMGKSCSRKRDSKNYRIQLVSSWVGSHIPHFVGVGLFLSRVSRRIKSLI